MSKKIITWIVGLSIGLILIYAVLVATGFINTAKRIRVAVEAAEKRTLVESVSASGKMYPANEVKISPDVSGEIIVLKVAEGDTVKKGQLLATINATTYRSVVNKAQAQLNQTQSGVSSAQAQRAQFQAQLDQVTATYNRNKKLFRENVISAAEFETAEASYKSALAQYNSAVANIQSNQYGVASARAGVSEAREQLQKTTIYAPMGGVVSVLNVKKGERVVGTAQMAGTEMMRISDMSTMKVDVEVGENDIVKIKIGDSASVEVEAYNNKKFRGIVTQISQSAQGGGLAQATSMNDQVTNYTVSITIDSTSYSDLTVNNPGRSPFRPGMSASVEIFTMQKSNVLTVPINAVTTRVDDESDGNYSDAIKEFVFIDSSGFAVLREVKTGLQDNKYVEVLNGIKEKQIVLTAPYGAIARSLKSKDKIKIVKKEDLYEDKKE